MRQALARDAGEAALLYFWDWEDPSGDGAGEEGQGWGLT